MRANKYNLEEVEAKQANLVSLAERSLNGESGLSQSAILIRGILDD